MKIMKYRSSVYINRAEHDVGQAGPFEYFVSMNTNGRFRIWYRSKNCEVGQDLFMAWGSKKKTYNTAEAAHACFRGLFAPIPASQVKMEGESV